MDIGTQTNVKMLVAGGPHRMNRHWDTNIRTDVCSEGILYRYIVEIAGRTR